MMFSELSTTGILFLIIGWSFVIGLTVFTVGKVLKTDKKKAEKEQKVV
jgi:hypothetical protein